MADNEAAILAAAKKLPFDERLAHKTWKVRSELFEDVRTGCTKAFSSDDPILAKSASLFAPGLGDANLNVQDTAVEALCAWLQKADVAQASRVTGPVCATIASKVLKARPFTVTKATEACMLLVELEQQEAVVESMLKAAGDKVPKVAQAALEVVRSAVVLFGARVVDAKAVIRGLPAAFGSANAGVRDKAKEISVELAASLGAAAVGGALLDKMPPAVRRDVEGLIAALPPGRKQPERWTRREQAERAAAQGGAGDMDVDEAESADEAVDAAGPDADAELDADADPYDFATPVNPITPLAKETLTVGDDRVAFWDCFESKKWNVRKAALEHFKGAARGPRLEAGADYGPLLRELKKVLAKDANVTCAAAAAECAALLASGLRGAFAQGAKSLCPAVLERLKEKNIVMSRAADEALRAMGTHCYSVADVADDLLTGLQHKNPKVRLETAKLTGFMAERATKAVAQKALKESTLAAALGTLASDADAGVREAAMSALAAFAARAGSLGAVEKGVEKLDEGKRKKVEEAVAALVKRPAAAAAAAAGGAPKAKPAAAAPAPAQRPRAAVAPKTSLTPGVKRGAAKAPAATASPPGSGGAIRAGAPTWSARSAGPGAKPAGAPAELAAAPRLSPEEVAARVPELFGAEVWEGLQSAKWQERLEAVGAIEAWVSSRIADEDAAFSSIEAGTVAQCLACVPGWSKEKNFQVINKGFEIVAALAGPGPGLARADALTAIEPLAERLAELKHRLPAAATLSALAESATPGFVAAELRRVASAAKNPKVPAETLGWTATAITEFGLAAGKFDVAGLLGWAREALGSAAAPVRSRGVELLGALHATLGPAIAAQAVEGLKPAQASQVEDAFKKSPQGSAPEPVRQVKKKVGKAPTKNVDASAAVPLDEAGDVEMADADDDADALLPRADISSAITPSLLELLGSSNWKERSVGLDGVEEVLRSAGGRVGPNLGPELLPALRARLADTNRNLAARALGAIGRLAAAVGPRGDWERAAQRAQLLPAVAACLSDNKRQVRDAVLGALREWLAVGGPDVAALAATADVVAGSKTIADGKVAALQWMASAVAALPSEQARPAAADAVARAAVAASRDKAGAVREAGNALVAAAAAQLGAAALSAAGPGSVAADKKAYADLLAKAGVGAASQGKSGGAGAPAPRAAAAPPPAARSAASATPAGSRSASAASATTSLRAALAEAPAPSTEPLLAANVQAKTDRARRFRVRSMRFEGVGEDEAELLERELGTLASAELRADLFSADFRSQLRAADRLSAELARDGGWPGLAANLDLLFRWVVLRLVEGNSQVAARVLDLSLALLQGVQLHGDGGDGCSESAQLSDAEALSLLPAVVERSGHPQDRIRAQHRAVLRAALPVYAVPKLLEVLTPGLSSKSARTRAETAEFMAATLLQERGSAALTALIACRARPLVAIGGLLRDRDAPTRAAAMGAVEVAVTIGGEEVLRQFGRLEPREQGMVEERLRRSRATAPGGRGAQGRGGVGMTAAAAATTASAVPYAAASPAPRAPPMETPSRDAAWGQPALSSVPTFTPPAPLHATPPVASYYDEPHGVEEYETAGQRAGGGMYAEGPLAAGYGAASTAATAPPPASSYALTAPYAPDPPKQLPPAEDPTFERRWEAQMQALASPDSAAVVEAMKAVCGELMPAAEGAAAPRTVALMARSAETLFARVHAALVGIFAEAAAAPSGRLPYPARGCKYGLNVMLQGLAVREVACGLSQRTLRACVSLLLLRLLDDHGLLRFEEGHTLVKAVNVLMLKMLETTDRTYCFGALLQLLRVPPADPVLSAHGCDGSWGGGDGLGQAPPSSSVTPLTTSSPALVAKFHDLVVKCLIKLTKGLQADVASVDVGALLLDIHDFFLFLGVDEIRRRSGVEDKPLRMVKTILHELCKLLGYGIYAHAEKIPGRAAQPQPIIFAYISLNLSTLSASGVIQPPAEAAPGGRTAHPSAGSTSSTTSSASSSQQLADTSASGALAREEDRAAVKAGLKEIMPRLMHRSEADAAMKQLHELRSAYPVFVDKYIAGTSDMFRAYIRDGLAALEAARADEGDQLVAPSVASDEGSEPLALAPEPAPARPAAVAPPRLAVPPSPNSLEAGALTPGGTLLTPSSASVVRLSSLRERLANARYSLEGNAAPPKPLVSPARSRATGDLSSVRSAIDDLAERMAALRRASHTSG